jgi:hypothetical protein
VSDRRSLSQGRWIGLWRKKGHGENGRNMTYRKKQRTSTVLPRLTPLSLRPSALVNEQVSMHYERSDQVGRAGRRQRRDVAMAAVVAEEGSKEGGQSCNRDATRIHTHGGVSGRRQSKSESEVSSVVVVVSTAVGQTGSSQGLHSYPTSPRQAGQTLCAGVFYYRPFRRLT